MEIALLDPTTAILSTRQASPAAAAMASSHVDQKMIAGSELVRNCTLNKMGPAACSAESRSEWPTLCWNLMVLPLQYPNVPLCPPWIQQKKRALQKRLATYRELFQ